MYVRANDANGDTWALSSAVYPADELGTQELSLIDAGGSPALIFYNQTNRMYFKRASDANGDTWNTNPIVPDLATITGRYNSAINVNGMPAISYYDFTNQNLKYVRASTANGSSWNTPVVVDAPGNVGLHTSIALVDGHPAIAYFDDTNDDLKYVRANDADGLSWGNPVTVFSEGGTGRFPSLAVYEGVPVLVFQGALPFSVEFIKALDATGSSWGSPQTIHNIGQTGEQNQVRVLGNRIGLGWYASQDQSMYYAAGLPCESPVLPELSASQSEVCQGSSVELFASGNGAIHWFSDATGENFLATGESFTVSELESSNSFFASSNSCGEFSALSEITIDVIPSTTINQQFSVCEGEFVTVGDNEYFNTGNFQDVFTSVLGCDSIVNTQLTVNDFPEASVSLNDLTISASPDNANYQWITCDGELIEGETSQTFQVSAPGSYAVIVDFEGCADTSSCLEVSVTGVQENINFNLSIYPNPASDDFKFSDSKEHQWEIYTVSGQLIKTGFSSTVASSELSSGLYILNCKDAEVKVFRFTVIR